MRLEIKSCIAKDTEDAKEKKPHRKGREAR